MKLTELKKKQKDYEKYIKELENGKQNVFSSFRKNIEEEKQ